jgi:hypothetical protein
MRTALFAQRTKSSRRRGSVGKKPTILQLEPLEDRSLLSFTFQAIDFLGTTAPGTGNLQLINDFEPGRINNRGDVAFGADLGDSNGNFLGEGVYLWHNGQLSALARSTDPTPAPDNTTFGSFFLGNLSLNDAGDAPFVFQRQPETIINGNFLFGDNAGLYFYSHLTGAVTPLVLPGQGAPGGGTFHGLGFHAAINNQGTTVFAGIITPVSIGPGADLNLGQGIYEVDNQGHLTKVMRPGDPAPGGKTFDWAQNPWINNSGDVAFTGHVLEEPCIQFSQIIVPGETLFCAESVYVRRAATGEIQSIAHIGDPAPGGGVFRYAYGPQENARGQIAFFGAVDASPAGSGHLPLDTNTGLFLNSNGTNTAIVRPGDAMPGGGHLATVSFLTGDMGLNNTGVISFTAQLDTQTGGIPDTGLYEWTNGTLSLVARSGMTIPGAGTILAFQPPGFVGGSYPLSGAAINEQGQIVFSVTLTDGRSPILIATPNDPAKSVGLAVGASATMRMTTTSVSGHDNQQDLVNNPASFAFLPPTSESHPVLSAGTSMATRMEASLISQQLLALVPPRSGSVSESGSSGISLAHHPSQANADLFSSALDDNWLGNMLGLAEIGS